MRLLRLKSVLRIAAIIVCSWAWLAAPALAVSQSVVIQNFSFQPQDVTINIGESVTWINHDPVGHTATSDASGLFDTGVIAPAGNKTVSFAVAGTYAYHCSIHPQLKGTVTVVGPTPTPGPSTPAPSPTASPTASASSTPAPSPTVAPSGTRITVPTNVAAASPGPSGGSAGPDLGAGPGPALAAGGLALAGALSVLAIYLYRRR